MQPVFIVGCQRSGSTLLGAMLGAHPKILCIPEAQFISDLLPARGAEDKPVDPVALIDQIEKHWRFRIWNFALGGVRPDQDEMDPTYRNGIEWLVREYGRKHERPDPQIWVEQQPGHIIRLWRLMKFFPDAKVIDIIRDGRAVAASLMPLDWGPNEIFAAARFWQRRVPLGYAAHSFLDQHQLMHLRYEDLIREPDTKMREIADFIGIDFHPSMTTSTGLKVPEFTRMQHALVGESLNPDRVDAWRTKLSKRQIEIFEKLNGNLLEQFGYELVTQPERIKPLGLTEKLILAGKDQLKRGINSVSFFLRRSAHRRTH